MSPPAESVSSVSKHLRITHAPVYIAHGSKGTTRHRKDFLTVVQYLRYDGTCWRENRQSSVGAVEEFLDLQLQDSLDEVQRCMDALVSAGVDEVTVKAGGKDLQKAVSADKMGLLFALLGAQPYYKFVMRYRNFRNIANTLSAAKPMVATAFSSSAVCAASMPLYHLALRHSSGEASRHLLIALKPPRSAMQGIQPWTKT